MELEGETELEEFSFTRQTDGDRRLPAPKAFPKDTIYVISLSGSSHIVEQIV